MIEQRKDHGDLHKETSVSRRMFLKKTVYAAPSLIVLGALSKPVTALGGSDTTNTGSGWTYGGDGGGPGNLGN